MKYRLVGFCEIDRFAVESYCAIHNVSSLKNIGDITSCDMSSLPDVSMVSGGSPCQDFSVAGKGKGSVWKCGGCGHEYNPLTIHYEKRQVCPVCGCERLEGTRSSLVIYFLKAVRYAHPKFGIFENVKALTNKKHRDTFELFLKELDEYGYNTYWKVLNARDYGIPQHRERVIVVFIRKDMDNGSFRFSDPIGTNFSLTCLMDADVPERFYITGEKVEKFLEEYFAGNADAKFEKNHNQRGAVETTGIYRTLIGGGHSGNEPKVLIQSGYLHGNADANRVYDSNGVARTIKAEAGGGGAKTGWYLTNTEPDGSCRTLKSNYYKTSIANFKSRKDRGATGGSCSAAVRKLTPKECFRLMGFDDADYEAAKAAGISNSQLYKQCGNSIVVDVLYYVLKSLRDSNPGLFEELSLFSLFSGIGAFEKALDKLGEPMEHDWDWDAVERMSDFIN